jgi:hypothetical protein
MGYSFRFTCISIFTTHSKSSIEMVSMFKYDHIVPYLIHHTVPLLTYYVILYLSIYVTMTDMVT